MGPVLARIGAHKALGICPQVKDQAAGCRNVEKKKSVSLDVLMEAENIDFEYELRFHRLAAWLDLILAESGGMTCRRLGGGRFSTQGPGRRFEDVRLLSGVQSEMRTSSGPIGAFLLLEILLLDCETTWPTDIKERLVKSAKLLKWQKKQIDETEYGMWSEPIITF